MLYSITFKWVVVTTGLHFQERNVSENLVREKKKKEKRAQKQKQNIENINIASNSTPTLP
jgi:hypothetical protein